MKHKYLSFFLILSILLLSPFEVIGQDKSILHIKSKKEVGQIEVGGPFVGIEIHKSFPMLNRISFYYPVANSIDISEDYWKRENYRIMSVGLKIGDSPKRLLENEVYEVDQTPYSVSFKKEVFDTEIKISYEFCKNGPAMVVTYEITNKSKNTKDYEIFTRIETTLRTSHSYKLKDNAYTEFDENGSVIRINYDDIETGQAQIFIGNAGLLPSSFTTKAEFDGKVTKLDKWWLENDRFLPGETIQKETLSKPVAAFTYNKNLQPDESIKIVQIIGSSKISEGNEKSNYLIENYEKEVQDYENYILIESLKKSVITTGNETFDFTARWAKAILATNAHYLNGHIVPMPAQAEYNFYFTHDALLTDLAAVNFDLDRVKNDLRFIISLADKEYIIPHAYYWKDTEYKTEFAGTENWNHFWFALLCARYLRHSGDIEFLNQLYPYIEKSIETALKNKGDDDLMWSFRPDWWDIGNNFGPRAYMTILAIRALREFNFISASINKEVTKLKFYEDLANRMNRKLVDLLWNGELNYLINYFEDGTEDRHIYMGSLLASHFDLLDKDKNLKLIYTAKKNLLDEKLGIYSLYPMDLHELIGYMKFSGNEAGDPYHYANGGIWPHGNAWYALGLINNGFNKEAYEFIKQTMTMNGVINSPNGQPAMYEYRVSDYTNPNIYGKIDKPQFLWAGGWYLYTLYNLFGLRENEWNISFDPYIPDELDSVKLTVTINGKQVPVNICGRGSEISSISFNETLTPSAVLPANLKKLKEISIKLGNAVIPYLSSVNAIVNSPSFNMETKTLEFSLKSFEGHQIEFEILSPIEKQYILVNGNDLDHGIIEERRNNLYEIKVHHLVQSSNNHYSIKFK